ncbi:MAG: kelch-like protein [Pseudomonadota bacterium]|nr:kelch-like protein [Pseudomonadota bacterium]
MWKVIVALAALHPHAARADWVPVSPMPTPVQEIYGDTHAGRFLTLGGFDDAGRPTTTALAYDPAHDAWSLLPHLPAPRHHVGVAVVGDSLYALGGFRGTPPDWAAVDEVLHLDLTGGAWRTAPPLPVPRGEHVSAVVDGKIYVIGGRIPTRPGADRFEHHTDTARMDVFDPATQSWVTGPDAPTPRNSAAAGVIDGRIHVVGGRQFGTDGQIRNVSTHEVYDPASGAWLTRAPLPEAQGGLSAAVVNGLLYACGGEAFLPRPNVFAACWTYDPAADMWSPLPDMRTPRHGTAAAALNGSIYVFGGATVAGFGAVATVERLTR